MTRNTLLYNIAFLVLGVIFEMGSAILLNELFGKWFKKIAQSFMFLPYFISWVVAGAIMYNIFNYERGVFNHVLNMVGANSFGFVQYTRRMAVRSDFPENLETDGVWFRGLSGGNHRTGSGNV